MKFVDSAEIDMMVRMSPKHPSHDYLDVVQPSESASTSSTVTEPISPAIGVARQARPRTLAVWTRELDGTERFGRTNVAFQIRTALVEIGQLTNRRLKNTFEQQSKLTSLLLGTRALLGGLLSGQILPLQCALFATVGRKSPLLVDAQNADVAYLDGIRTSVPGRRRPAQLTTRIVKS